MSLIDELIRVANRYGADPTYSRAGGGNASAKVDGVLHIKPSGVPLATLTAADLVPLRIDVLLDALHADDPVDGDPVRVAAERARVGDPAGRRPSVEILFHALIPDALVVHYHPLVANAVTCNADGAALTASLLGEEAVFVPYTDPGVPLAREVARARAAHTERTGRPAPGITLLGNHGIIVSGDSEAQLIERTDRLTRAVATALEAAGPAAEVEPLDAEKLRQTVAVIGPTLRGLLGTPERLAVVTSDASDLVRSVTLTAAGAALATGGPLIPDQIVYAGSFPLIFTPRGADLAGELTAAVAAHIETHRTPPIIVVIPGLVAFGAGKDLAAARTALGTFTDALAVAWDAERLGQVRTLAEEERSFIETWEAESYRQKIAVSAQTGRMDGKVVVITGAAQGFGLGLATEVLAEGGQVVLADLNLDLAEQQAAELSRVHGNHRAVAVGVNVADEQSQGDAAAAVTALFGGLDVFISNAGVLRAEGVMTQPVVDFDLVTDVNYKGYFLGVRAVAPILAAQHAAQPGFWSDIIEINSKSGLEGSKRNFAYAGSKFGGIGLTQSFALEMVEYGVKVNAICPGNYLDGPLWTDPERGLFVQYLRAGKVPGAETVEDVRRFYEAKVPLGRGCLPADIAKAVYYIVDQAYETGQAVPVTGGQNMLS
ncbi:MAG: SDR family NAD(P)-dependent oxidoreductase [Propioniciclava sp.]